MATEAERAVAACVAYVEAQAEVKRLTRAIGEALDACHSAHAAKYLDKLNSPAWESHLTEAYSHNGDDEWGGYMEPEDQEEYLAEKCPHCLAAHRAIQKRKAARKTFGAAKRWVGTIGRMAARNQTNTKD